MSEKSHQQLWGTILSIFRGLLLSNFTVKKIGKKIKKVGLVWFFFFFLRCDAINQ